MKFMDSPREKKSRFKKKVNLFHFQGQIINFGVKVAKSNLSEKSDQIFCFCDWKPPYFNTFDFSGKVTDFLGEVTFVNLRWNLDFGVLIWFWWKIWYSWIMRENVLFRYFTRTFQESQFDLFWSPDRAPAKNLMKFQIREQSIPIPIVGLISFIGNSQISGTSYPLWE